MGNNNSSKIVYEFLKDYMLQNSYSPTIREICAGTGFYSTATIYNVLQKLERNGLIRMSDHRTRIALIGYKLVRDESIQIEEL